MKNLLIAVSLLALTMGAAQAEGEGNHEPFPNTAAGNEIVGNQVLSDTGSASYPNFGSGISRFSNEGILPSNGSEGAVQTANSLPKGFEDGTVAYAQAQSIQRWTLAHQAQPATRLTARTANSYN